jgi:hypothetical protein
MPFQSKSQLRACFALKAKMEKEGKTPTWDCHKWYHESETPFQKLPDYKYATAKIHTGPRGGKFLVRGNRKVYLR